MSNPLDRLWRWADRVACVRRAGTDAVSTQWHHALVCAFGAGLGSVTALAFHWPPLVGAWIVWGLTWLAYVVRERRQHALARILGGNVWGWDSWMDLLTPLCWGLVGLSGGTRTLAVWLAASVVLAVGYVILRPASK